MTAYDAALALNEHLTNIAAVQSVGIGEKDGDDAIFVYVTTLRDREVESLQRVWEGFPVVVKKIGRIAPLAR